MKKGKDSAATQSAITTVVLKAHRKGEGGLMGSHELGLSLPNLALFAHASTKCLGSVGAWSHQDHFATVTKLFKAGSLLLK